MLVDSINLCGGISNISRVLVDDDRLIFEIKDQTQLQLDGSEASCNDVLGHYQVSYLLPQMLLEQDSFSQDLLSIGKDIHFQQLSDIELVSQPIPCIYRPNWHISPPQGLLNDPNGFIYHRKQYHLFYQWSPFTCSHKDKYWAHLTSSDLVNWEWQPVALTPSDWFDSHGVFSGHALSVGDELWLYYTGNTRIGPERTRQTTQCLATSKDGIHFEKQGPVIHCPAPNVTEHMRDPKIIKNNDQWLMLLGAQREDLKGRLAVYKSDDLQSWTFDKLYGDELGDFGYMWECPDIFTLNQQSWLVIGPQGIESASPYHTIPHHNGIAKVEISDNNQLHIYDFTTLDHGFDFYAPQTLLTPDNRRIMCGWMGLPDDIKQPSQGWLHQLTCLRELTYQDGKLRQWPISELEQLHLDAKELVLTDNKTDLKTKSFDLSLAMNWGQTLHLFANDQQSYTIQLDEVNKRLILDRSQTLIQCGDTKRELTLDTDKVDLRILADNSSLEVFINGGEHAMSARVFTDEDATQISLTGGSTLAAFSPMKASLAPFY